jgi:preprotein translocase subunit SecE
MARNRQRSKQRQAARREARVAAREDAGLISGETGAPPENVGRSDTVAESSPPAPILDGTLEADELEGDGATMGQPVHGTGLGRVGAFLTACWAELQRVQWPDRRQLMQLTGIVLFFVILAGAYLGALDAVFSKLIQAIL